MPTKYVLFFSFLLLSACATLQPVIDHSTTPISHATALERWQFQGKMSLINHDNHLISRITWQQQHADYNVLLTAPLGQGWLSLRGNDMTTTYEDSDGQYTVTDNPNALLQDLGHGTVPVKQLQFWLKGIAAPGLVRKISYRTDGLIKILVQDGWKIQYTDYEQVQPHLKLPRKIEMQQEATRIKLIIKQWAIWSETSTQSL